MFQFDTGLSNAELSARYVHDLWQQFAGLMSTEAAIGGAGGVRPLTAYSLLKPVLHLGTAIATFSNLTAVAEERGVCPQDHLYGDLGQGLLNQFCSHTIDFTRMQLTVSEYD